MDGNGVRTEDNAVPGDIKPSRLTGFEQSSAVGHDKCYATESTSTNGAKLWKEGTSYVNGVIHGPADEFYASVALKSEPDEAVEDTEYAEPALSLGGMAEVQVPMQFKSEISAASKKAPLVVMASSEGAENPPNAKQKRRSETILANKRKLEEESDKLRFLVSHFSEKQLEQYEMNRRSCFPQGNIRKVIHSITGAVVPQNVVIAMAGLAKVFVGEIVEEALDVEERWEEIGPLQPKHIREAVRVLKEKGTIPRSRGHLGPTRRNTFSL